MERFKYTSLWLLLAVALIVIISVSFADDISIGDWTVKKAPIAEFIFDESDSLAKDSVIDSVGNGYDPEARGVIEAGGVGRGRFDDI